MIEKRTVTAAVLVLGIFASLSYTVKAQQTPTQDSTTPTIYPDSTAPTTYPSRRQTAPPQRGVSPLLASKISPIDRQFMNAAAQSNRAEIVLSQLATERGVSNSVKQYGQHMVNDHTKASRQLKQLADRISVTLLNGIDADHKEARTRLGQMSGRRFDSAFIKQMVSDHVDTVSLFQKEIRQGTDPDVKNFARKTLPTLQEHLRMVRQLRSNR